MNLIGLWTLFYKEILRFWKVLLQTVAAPILTSLLYLMVFAQALSAHVQVYPGVGYTAFLIPGLAMMAILQNAFANGSSSLIQSKITGNIAFILLAPISHLEFFLAYLLAAVVRGVLVGLGVLLVGIWATDMGLAHPFWVLAWALIASVAFAAMGVIAGIWADKFDHLSGIQNFVILPLTFLSGVFYSIHSLSPFWQMVSQINPVFYMIDGFRYGFFGQGDVNPWWGLAVALPFTAALCFIAMQMIVRGYKLRN
jgi:ABC-2 type transport system permease protein